MSAKILGQVWDLQLTAAKQLIMLALADHADHNGDNAYPSIDLIAWKTGYSERQVRRILKSLVKDKILIQVSRPGRTSVYSIRLENGIKKLPYTKSIGQNDTPDKMTAVTQMSDHPGHPDVRTTPDTQMSDEPSSKPSNNRQSKPDPIFDAISHVWKTKAGAIIGNMKSMMLGIAKTGDWAAANFDTPATADEITAFGQWYKRKNPDLTIPNKPEKIQRWFYEYRQAAAKRITPIDPAHDLSIAVDFEPMLVSRLKAASNE